PHAVLAGGDGVVEAVVSGRAASAELALDELFAVALLDGAFAVVADEQAHVLALAGGVLRPGPVTHGRSPLRIGQGGPETAGERLSRRSARPPPRRWRDGRTGGQRREWKRIRRMGRRPDRRAGRRTCSDAPARRQVSLSGAGTACAGWRRGSPS